MICRLQYLNIEPFQMKTLQNTKFNKKLEIFLRNFWPRKTELFDYVISSLYQSTIYPFIFVLTLIITVNFKFSKNNLRCTEWAKLDVWLCYLKTRRDEKNQKISWMKLAWVHFWLLLYFSSTFRLEVWRYQ